MTQFSESVAISNLILVLRQLTEITRYIQMLEDQSELTIFMRFLEPVTLKLSRI